MSRRIVVAVACAAFAPAAAIAQQATLPRVLFLGGDAAFTQPYLDSFRSGLRDAGHREGKTLQLVVRYREDGDSLDAAVRMAVAERPDVLVIGGLAAARLSRDATTTIPVVVGTASDLVDGGVVKSFARPGGNITGVSDLVDEAAVKRLELLRAALPGSRRVALLVNPDFPATAKIESRVGAAAPGLGFTIVTFRASNQATLDAALNTIVQAAPDALLIGADPMFNNARFMKRATATRIPIVHYWQGTAELGAIVSYEVDVLDNWRRAAGYVDKILKGAKPGDLPIHQPTRYKLVINEKAAKGLGLAIPQAFLQRADEVIR